MHSGSFDRASYALSIAQTALAMGMEVHMLFTYGGLRRLVKGQSDIVGDETDKEMLEPVQKGLAKGHIEPFSVSLEEAKKMGLKVYACVSAMANLNVTRDELIKEVDAVVGLASFLELCKNASINLYI